MDGRYAGNAGAISGGPWMAGMPEMQEQFLVGYGRPVCGNAVAISANLTI